MTQPRGETALGHESLASLLDEVSAMSRARRSLVAGLASLDDSALGKLGRAAAEVRARIDQGQPPPEAIASLSPKFGAVIRVAMETMSATGSTRPVYEAARLIRDEHTAQRQMRLAVINPMLNVVVAAAVLFFVLPWILVSLTEAELIPTPDWPSASQLLKTFATQFAVAAIATVITVAVIGFVFYRWTVHASPKLRRLKQEATFCRWLSVQLRCISGATDPLSGGADLGRLIEAAADVAGPDSRRRWQATVEEIQKGSITDASLSFPQTTSEPLRRCVLDLVTGQRQAGAVALDLERLGQLYGHQFESRRQWRVESIPRALSWILLVMMILVLLRGILVPLLETIAEIMS